MIASLKIVLISKYQAVYDVIFC